MMAMTTSGAVGMVPLKWKALVVSVVCSSVLIIGVMFPGQGSAKQDKKLMCHLGDDGSYHLINVPEPSWATHEAHGDAGVGEAVPGQEGFVFDEECNVVEAGGCPCGSADAYLALWEDVRESEELQCIRNDIPNVVSIDLISGSVNENAVALNMIAGAQIRLGGFCGYRVWQINGTVFREASAIFLTRDELDACLQDIGDVIPHLGGCQSP